MRFLRWLTWRLWARGPWQNFPPDEVGGYLMRTKDGPRWTTPRRVECVQIGARVCQEELLRIPYAERRWMKWR